MDDVSRRSNAIQKCISWIEESFNESQSILNQDLVGFGVSCSGSSNTSSSVHPPRRAAEIVAPITEQEKKEDQPIIPSSSLMIGAFVKKDIQAVNDKGLLLLSIPSSAILNCTDSTLQKENIPVLQSILNDAMEAYELYAERSFEKNILREYDFYKHNNCRMCHDGEIRLTIFLTILFCFLERRSCSNDNKEGGFNIDILNPILSEELRRITDKWSPYLNTLPKDFTSLPPFWSAIELENIKGTSFSNYISRVQNEYIENWDNVIGPCLVNAGISHEEYSAPMKEENKNSMDRLPSYYTAAIAIVQSRTHGSNSSESEYGEPDELGRIDGLSMNVVLHPLIDLVNGERDKELINCEVEFNPQQKSVELRAICDIKAGEELIVSYGDAVNFSYLQRFGFLPFRNGLPDPHCTCVFQSLPTSLLPADDDKLRWEELEMNGFHKENFASQVHGTGPFNIVYDNEVIRTYRKTELHTPNTSPPQMDHFIEAAHILLFNEKALHDVAQEPHLASYDRGKMMVTIIDLWLSQLNTPSNKFDFNLVQNQRGNLRMGTYMRMLERETLIKWRHAICIRHGCYDYDNEFEETGVKHVPPLASMSCCYICKASFHVKKCTRCKMVCYCSVKCQKEHWRRGHREVCGKATKR